jgi:hypothetical protein
VNSKYGIVKNQLEDPDGMTRDEVRYLNNLTTHLSSEMARGEDYAEFFDGTPPVDIMNQITRSHLVTGLVPIHHVVPYDRHDVNEEYRVNLLPGVTDTEEKYRGITYHNGNGLNVCIPQILMMKISVSGYILEVKLSNESVLFEKEVSRSLSPKWREDVCAKSLDIIKAAVQRSQGVNKDVSLLLLSPQVDSWPRVIHQHLTVD